MIKDYKTIYEGGVGEIVEKKSRFIGTIAHVESEEEAIAFIERVKKQYWDARHNCFAYIIGHEIMRCSDDGEPAQTAGKPMLDVLSGQGLYHSIIVEKHLADEWIITTDYNGIGKIQYLLAQEGLMPTNTKYTDIVIVTVPVPVDQAIQLKAKIIEGTNGRAKIQANRQLYYGIVGKETILFDS